MGSDCGDERLLSSYWRAEGLLSSYWRAERLLSSYWRAEGLFSSYWRAEGLLRVLIRAIGGGCGCAMPLSSSRMKLLASAVLIQMRYR